MTITPSELVTSSADSLSGDFTTDGNQTSFGPIGSVSGTAPPPFDQTHHMARFDESQILAPSPDPTPTAGQGTVFGVQARDLVNTATSAGIGIDDLSTQSTADIASANFSLTDSPLSTLVVLGLTGSATFIRSASSADYVFGPNQGSLTGSAAFGSLSIGGPLIGKTVTFSGAAAANTILYQSATVTITLDKQTLSSFLPPGVVPPPTTPPVTPNRITTDALDITLTNAHFAGHSISGDFRLGESSATYYTSPVPHA